MISDEQLRFALETYENAILDALPEPKKCFHRYSAGFTWKMGLLCHKTKHPVAYKVLLRAACVLLALMTLFGGTVAAYPEVREAVEGWVKEQFGRFDHYYNSGETIPESAEHPQYELAWLPEGYAYLDTLAQPNDVILIYMNDAGYLLRFAYFYPGSDGTFLEVSDHARKTITIDDYTVDIYIAPTSSESNAIVWIDTETEIMFMIAANVDEAELIQLMQSVVVKE